jgi:predicted transposase YdaD
VLEKYSRGRKLQAIIEALALIGVGKAMADSREVIQETLALTT